MNNIFNACSFCCRQSSSSCTLLVNGGVKLLYLKHGVYNFSSKEVALHVNAPSISQLSSQVITTVKVFAVAALGILLFSLLHLPMPWLLGSIFAVMLSQLTISASAAWELPKAIRNGALVVLGAAIGCSFTLSAFSNMGHYVLYMLLLNVVLLSFCIILALLTMKLTGLSFMTALTAGIPGGLSQSVAFAEEQKGIDLGAVTYFQVIRVLSIVSIVPFIVSGKLNVGAVATEPAPLWQLALYLLAAGAAAVLAQKVKFPVAYFLAPVLAGIIVNLLGIAVITVPDELLHAAQLAIGSYIGLLLKPDMIKLPWKVVAAGLASSIILLGFSYFCAILLSRLLHVDLVTSFLSTAAGGMDQMSLIAAALKVDATIVTVFQMFRLLFIYFVIFPLLHWLARHNAARRLLETSSKKQLKK